jgi:hypothetical protein
MVYYDTAAIDRGFPAAVTSHCGRIDLFQGVNRLYMRKPLVRWSFAQLLRTACRLPRGPASASGGPDALDPSGCCFPFFISGAQNYEQASEGPCPGGMFGGAGGVQQ